MPSTAVNVGRRGTDGGRRNSNGSATATDDYLGLVRRFPLVPIRSDTQLRAAHKMIDLLSIIDEANMTAGQADYLDVLSDLTLKYEDERHRIDLSKLDAVNVLKFLLAENGMSASDLGRLLGNRELGGKLLRRERALSRTHVLALAKRFRVEPGLFL